MVTARSDAPPGMSGEYSSAGEVKKMKFGGRVEIALNVGCHSNMVGLSRPAKTEKPSTEKQLRKTSIPSLSTSFASKIEGTFQDALRDKKDKRSQ
jgi:hypothetical protein